MYLTKYRAMKTCFLLN